ncbi:diphthine methyltransferase-like [Littorina saxatilis]|uniref:methylated diphthine methylhydrolase n=1 Tax=Littorina saxatilis TaxID=31220 RepID=A0AAN9BYE1_9CAEN
METSPSALQVIDTQLCADSAEWCPLEGLQDVLLCGTYQLLESEESAPSDQVRVGQLQVYHLNNSDSKPILSKSHGIDMPGILDIKWARQRMDTAAVCGLVNAKGELQLWKIGERGTGETEGESETQKVTPECLKTVEIAPDCIGLSLDWSAPFGGSSARVVTSDSKGRVSVFDVTSDVTMTSQWHAHDFEAWICAFDQWNTDILYSGSDDCKLKVWDLRVGETPVSTNSRFTMGVCSMQSSPLRENLLAVGSYDENLSVFDTRKMRQPISTTPLGGGVWRVKWDPFSGHNILTASMHNGFHIVDCSKQDAEPLPVLAHYTNHTSLAYGVDWCRLKTQGENTNTDHGDENMEHCLLASCSFYDHSLQVWQWPE